MWWYKNRRTKQISPSTFPFEVINPNGNVLSMVFGADQNGPLADSCVPYQTRLANRNIRRELENKLEEYRWLLIVGRTGLGKTREAAELAQIYNREGWTVLWLKSTGLVDEPTQEQLKKIGTNRKLLFFLDDLNQRMHYSSLGEVSNRPEENSEYAPLIMPLQERLQRVLEAYEQFYGQEKIRVIAIAGNEKEPEILGEPSEWEKLQWEKYEKQWWRRFFVYELPEPENEAIVQLLSDSVSQAKIKVNEEDYPFIAAKNDSTFKNAIANLRRLQNRGLPLTIDNYIESHTSTWEQCYADAVKKFSGARHIYDAVDLLQQFNISPERSILEPTALLMMQENRNFWQELWYRWLTSRALNYLIERERILNEANGQIVAKDKRVEADEYVRPLLDLVLQLTDKYPQDLLGSLFNFGCQLSNSNRPEEALACFNKLSTFVSEISDVWFYQGVALEKMGCHSDAVVSYDKALEIKPDYYQASYNRGVALRKLEQYSDAIASYDKALAIKSDLDQAWNSRGLALANLGQYSDAIASYDKALAINPDLDQTWNSRGLALWNLRRYSDAIASYDKALAIKPDYYQAWYNRSVAQGNLGRYSDAVASCDKALEIKPDYYQAWYNRGVALGNLGRYSDAVASCDKALEIKPDLDQAWNTRGVALGNLGRYSDAVASYDKALILKPDYFQAWYNRGVALYFLGLYSEAVTSYKNVLAIKPDYYQAWNNQGVALGSLGRYSDAVDSYDKALSIKPDYYEAWNNRGNALYLLKRYSDAVDSYDKALSLKPEKYQAWKNRGNALNQLGRYSEAVFSLNKAIELAPDSFDAHYNKACSYALQENVDLTLENLKRAIKLNPKCREMIKNDSGFGKILKNERFKALIAESK